MVEQYIQFEILLISEIADDRFRWKSVTARYRRHRPPTPPPPQRVSSISPERPAMRITQLNTRTVHAGCAKSQLFSWADSHVTTINRQQCTKNATLYNTITPLFALRQLRQITVNGIV